MSAHAASTGIATDNEALRRKASAVVDASAELGSEAKKYASHRLQDAKETAGDLVHSARERIAKTNDAVVDYIQENPMKSVAIAVGVGFLVGYLLKRR